MNLPSHLAPLAEPGAFYRAVAGRVCRTVGDQPVAVADVPIALQVAVDMAMEAGSDERAELWLAQLSDLIRAARVASRQSFSIMAEDITQPMNRRAA